MANYKAHEADPGYSHDISVVRPDNTVMELKRIYSTDMNGTDYTVEQTKVILLSELDISNPQEYALVMVKSDNSRTVMNDSDDTIEYIHDIASDAYIEIKPKRAN